MSFSPGSVKDFAREIDQTNKRINLRKTQLEKQARARAAVIKPAATSEPKPTVVLASAPAPITPAPQRVVPPSSAASPPLHPSLPAKPGTQPVVPPHQPSPAPTPQQTPAPVTNPAPAAPPVVPEAKDPMIMKFEEVCRFSPESLAKRLHSLITEPATHIVVGSPSCPRRVSSPLWQNWRRRCRRFDAGD